MFRCLFDVSPHSSPTVRRTNSPYETADCEKPVFVGLPYTITPGNTP